MLKMMWGPALSIQVNFLALLIFEPETLGLTRPFEIGDFHHKLREIRFLSRIKA